MGKNISILLATLVTGVFLFQCRTKSKTDPNDEMYKEIYLDQFKLVYFQMLLIKSYNNSKAINEIIAQDHSGFTEPVLSVKDLKLIDSLTTQDNLRLKADSASSIGRVAEGAEGKHTFTYILDMLDSRWIDSLAHERYGKLDGDPFAP